MTLTDKQLNQHIFRIITKKHGLKITNEAIQYLKSMFTETDLEVGGLIESLDYIAQQYVQSIIYTSVYE
jgi:DNA polymerase III delta subunit